VTGIGASDLKYASYDVLAWNDSAIVVAVARTGTITDGITARI